MWDDSSEFRFSHRGEAGPIEHPVFVKGTGAPILILQELPGIGQQTFDLAERLIAAGFRVYLPHLLGRLGKANKLTSAVNALRLLCVRREIDMFLTGRQSPIAAWLRALTAEIKVREGGSPLGVIGMCLTGSFVIPLMAEDAVQGAVASQPALPVRKHDKLHMSSGDVDRASAAMDRKGPALVMRYDRDPMSTKAHMKALRKAFGNHLDIREFGSRSKGDHSLLTLDFSEEAYAATETYFRARLLEA